MTFSILGVDGAGAIGSAICSSSPAVAARCVHLLDGVGGVNSQNITDPRLGGALLERLARGLPPVAALREVEVTTASIEFRQLLVIDPSGRSAVYSGGQVLGVHGAAQGAMSVAAGNLLSAPELPERMVAAFEAADGELELRLLAAVQAAMAAGGEAGPVHSAGLSVVRAAGWRETDLRVDWSDHDPIGDLASLVDRWLPQRDDYVLRGHRPQEAPSYGVAGDV